MTYKMIKAVQEANDPAALRRELERGADPDFITKTGWTPGGFAGETLLIDACKHQSIKECKLLLRMGADPSLPTSEGLSPLAVAVISNSPKICELLIISGADHSFLSNLGKTALDYAIEFGHHECAAAIISAIAAKEAKDVNQSNKRRRAGL